MFVYKNSELGRIRPKNDKGSLICTRERSKIHLYGRVGFN